MPPRLIARSEEARRAIDGDFLTIERLPFRVGGDSRSPEKRIPAEAERRKGAVGQINDLYLCEDPDAEFHHVSREHFLIDAEHGLFFVVDRRSACGTIVGGKIVGGNRAGGRIALHDQDIIVAGNSASPYVFKFVVS
jgi:pSer/pThr/pTyr-binding forkhead associated (FHA) protein